MKKRKQKNRIVGGFVPVTYEMIESEAYKKLTGAALKALLLCMRKVKTHENRYSIEFFLTYPEARKQGLWDSAFARGMKQLQEVGFIECVMKGGMRLDRNACSIYRLSLRWKNFRTPEFVERHAGHCEAIHGK
jgi:hypothetical protein